MRGLQGWRVTSRCGKSGTTPDACGLKGLDNWSRNPDQQSREELLGEIPGRADGGLRAKFDSFTGETDDEANGHGGDARAFTRSELAMWETARGS